MQNSFIVLKKCRKYTMEAPAEDKVDLPAFAAIASTLEAAATSMEEACARLPYRFNQRFDEIRAFVVDAEAALVDSRCVVVSSLRHRSVWAGKLVSALDSSEEGLMYMARLCDAELTNLVRSNCWGAASSFVTALRMVKLLCFMR